MNDRIVSKYINKYQILPSLFHDIKQNLLEWNASCPQDVRHVKMYKITQSYFCRLFSHLGAYLGSIILKPLNILNHLFYFMGTLMCRWSPRLRVNTSIFASLQAQSFSYRPSIWMIASHAMSCSVCWSFLSYYWREGQVQPQHNIICFSPSSD